MTDILCIAMHVGLDALGLLPYPLKESLYVGTSIATVIAGIVEFMFAFHVGVALRKISIDRDAFETLSNRDPLTGLLNRRSFMSLIGTAPAGHSFAIFDIDNFKHINDNYGHAFGDAVIVEVARTLQTCLGDCSSGIARLGGEEFAAILTFPSQVSEQRVGDTLRCIALLALDHDGQAVAEGRDEHETYRTADRALYIAKAAGRGRLVHDRNADEVERGLDPREFRAAS